MRLVLSFLLLTAAPMGRGGSDDVLRTAAEVNAIAQTGTCHHARFHLRGLVSGLGDSSCIMEDKSGRVWICHYAKHPIPAAAEAEAEGFVYPSLDSFPMWKLTNVRIVRELPPQNARDIRLTDLDRAENDLLKIQTTGCVISRKVDELDTSYEILVLKDGAARMPVFVQVRGSERNVPIPAGVLGSTVRITGFFHRSMRGLRKYSGSYIAGTALETVTPAPDNPFDVPELTKTWFLHPDEINALDRRKVSGTVLATWGESRLLIRSNRMLVLGAELSASDSMPEPGSQVDIVGYPQADPHYINLRNARWRSSAGGETTSCPDDRVVDFSPTTEADFAKSFSASLMRFTGTVCDLPAANARNRRFTVANGGQKVLVDVTTHPQAAARLSLGAEIEVRGHCLVNTEAWRKGDVFPRTTGFVLVVRSADDIRIVRNPPWLTPMRCLMAVVILLAVLAAVFLWNMSLHVLVMRRGHQLFKAQYLKSQSELRVMERTRLAAELHDSLSQYLTGVALQINAGRNELAARLLKSCRDELRNCLWDLRNNAIDCGNMDAAIRQTLDPHVDDIDLSVRFNVRRSALSDNTAYAILRIIRELVVNAIRHGRAKSVRVAGSIEARRLLFSVRDDGCGFDPEHRPGIAEGHFGLQGVCERVATLGGTITFRSQPGEGAKVIVQLPVVQTEANRKLP